MPDGQIWAERGMGVSRASHKVSSCVGAQTEGERACERALFERLSVLKGSG